MAQDTNLRSIRSDETYAPAQGGRGNDPLAELARLIGQNDPFADLPRPDSRGQGRQQASQTAPEWLARNADPAAYEDPTSRRAPQGYEDQRDGRYADASYQDPQGAYGPEGTDSAYGYEANAYYDDDQLPPQGEETYEEAPPEKRRSGLTTIAALVALAIVGTGSVYAYRAWTGPSGAGGEPPVIKAEQTPTKVVPATASSDNQLNKQIYDRIGDRGGEKVVPREEQPVDVRAAARPTAPAPIGYAGSTGSVLPPMAPPPQQQAAAPSTEPKKVKTVPIRPDQPAGAPAQPQTRSVAPPSVAPPPPTRVATVPVQSIPSRTAGAESGSYVVQVASQRSEADAHASFRSLQQKYPTVLGNHTASIRRADLGERGVYYRAQVGPFSSAEQASEMCSSLKAAGGQCIVQRN
jgi:hypothetical protein